MFGKKSPSWLLLVITLQYRRRRFVLGVNFHERVSGRTASARQGTRREGGPVYEETLARISRQLRGQDRNDLEGDTAVEANRSFIDTNLNDEQVRPAATLF